MIFVPVPTAVPPHVPEYQCQLEFEPSEPPVNDKVVELPEHIINGFPVTDVAGEDNVPTVIVILTQDVVLAVPSALTQ